MKRLVLFLIVFACLSTGLLLAADPTEIDPDVVDLILNAGVLGVTFTFLIQLLKTKLKLAGPLVFVGSAVVSLVLTAGYFLFIAPPLTLEKELGYSFFVWIVGNGWYKFKTAKPTP